MCGVIFAGADELAMIDLVDPVHSQTIGLVPPTAMRCRRLRAL